MIVVGAAALSGALSANFAAAPFAAAAGFAVAGDFALALGAGVFAAPLVVLVVVFAMMVESLVARWTDGITPLVPTQDVGDWWAALLV